MTGCNGGLNCGFGIAEQGAVWQGLFSPHDQVWWAGQVRWSARLGSQLGHVGGRSISDGEKIAQNKVSSLFSSTGESTPSRFKGVSCDEA
jgi:hypothetical protein